MAAEDQKWKTKRRNRDEVARKKIRVTNEATQRNATKQRNATQRYRIVTRKLMVAENGGPSMGPPSENISESCGW